MKKWFLVFLVLCMNLNLIAQDREYVPGKKSFSNYYYSPLRISRDHPLHASIFQIPLFSAKSLENDTGLLGSSFEYTSIESKYKNDKFSYNFEGGLYRLNFNIYLNIREELDLIIQYDVAGVDGNKFTAIDGSSILKPDLKKSASGNIDVLAKQRLYTFEESGIDLGAVIGVSIPVVQAKTLANSRKFDFGGGLLATYQSDLFAIHVNAGFVYVDQSTAFTKEAGFNFSAYGGVSVVGKILNNWYAIGQVTVQNPALKSEFSPANAVGDFDLGVRYIYNAYITEMWVGHGFGNASHGVNAGLSFSLSF